MKRIKLRKMARTHTHMTPYTRIKIQWLFPFKFTWMNSHYFADNFALHSVTIFHVRTAWWFLRFPSASFSSSTSSSSSSSCFGLTMESSINILTYKYLPALKISYSRSLPISHLLSLYTKIQAHELLSNTSISRNVAVVFLFCSHFNNK